MNNINTVAVVGLQWGDEGKGKVVDILSEHTDVVARYCGGANAGHSVYVNGKKFATHLLPVGVFRSGVMNVICNGVVLDPVVLFDEIDALSAAGIKVDSSNLKISYKAHIVMPWHKIEDSARESSKNPIGTTKRGIGPAYADKMHRTTAIRVDDIVDEDRLKRKLKDIVDHKNSSLEPFCVFEPIDFNSVFETYRDYGKRLKEFVDDTSYTLINYRKQNKRIIFEGAHASLLDVDHGTYPYVTSSSCSLLGLFSGAGVSPQFLDNAIGVVKSYSTRVGAGPFPTEITDDISVQIRERGREYGTTTGRPRRIGWYDAMAVKYSADMGGISGIALTLLDVLSGIDQLKVCVEYRLNGKQIPNFIADGETLNKVEPIYITLPGWTENIENAKKFDDLPANAQNYIRVIEKATDVTVDLISVGPNREQTIIIG